MDLYADNGGVKGETFNSLLLSIKAKTERTPLPQVEKNIEEFLAEACDFQICRRFVIF